VQVWILPNAKARTSYELYLRQECVRYLHYFPKNIIFFLMWTKMRLWMERYLDKFDPLSMVTPRGVFCVNKGETDPNRVSLKQKKTSSLTNKQGKKYTQKKKSLAEVLFSEPPRTNVWLSLPFFSSSLEFKALLWCVCGSNFGWLSCDADGGWSGFWMCTSCNCGPNSTFLNVNQPT